MNLRRSCRRGILLAVSVLLMGCARADLLQGLDERQANEVVAVMLRHNIAADKRLHGKAGFMVQVPPGDLAEAIDLVQAQSLPSAPRTQIANQFPADAMLSTPLGERARLLSAIEQRLEESLAALEGVQVARVHVSYDAGSTEGSLQYRKPPAMHVAALLVHMPGVDEQVLLQSVKRFLRNAFVDVAYDNVSVVLTPAQPTRVLGVTAQEHRSGVWLALVIPLLLLVAVGALVWALNRSGWRGVTVVRRHVRRRKGARAHAR